MDDAWDDPDETTTVFDPSRSGADDRWYISRDGSTKEPVTAGQIIDLCTNGSINEGTLVWREGLSDWSPLGDVPELAQALRAFSRHPSPAGQAPPPIPAGQRPSLPSLPAHPSLPPLRSGLSTSPPARIGQRVSSLIIDERRGTSLHPLGHVAVPLVGQPLSLFTRDEPYSIIVPGGRRLGVWSLLAGLGVFTVAMLSGLLLFSADEAPGSDQEPIVIDYGVAGEPDTGDRGTVEEVVEDVPAQKPAANATQEGAPDRTGAKGDVGDEDKAGVGQKTGADAEDTGTSEDNAAERGDGKSAHEDADDEEEEAENDQPTTATIDRDAVNASLGKAAEQVEATCKASGEGKGAGKVRVLFTPSGNVAQVKLLTLRFRGTSAGTCVKEVFGKAKVPAYEGGNVAALKLFTVH